MSAATQLPEYRKPPVVEVACSIQFQPIDGLDTAHLGLLWSKYRERYPVTQQHTPLPNMIEVFGPPRASRVAATFLQTMPVPRAWFLNRDETRLVQIQQDRFVINWRKLDTDEEYPRYPAIRSLLEEEFAVFTRYLADESLPEVVADQVDLTYVNHLAAGEPDQPRRPLQEMVGLWSGSSDAMALPAPEEVGFHTDFIMNGQSAAEPLGRLHVRLESQFFVKTEAPLYVLTLTGRGAPEGAGLKGVLAFLDRAHEWIVQGFTTITTPTMHSAWERQR